MNKILINRIKAVAIDYLILCLIGFIPIMYSNSPIIAMFILYPLAINKDFLNGKSIGKRLCGIQVQNLKGGKTSEWNSALRNFLLIIPIDFFVTIINPTRRIGDIIAGTQIGYETEMNLKTIISELKEYRVNKELIIGLIYGFANIYGLLWLYRIILN